MQPRLFLLLILLEESALGADNAGVIDFNLPGDWYILSGSFAPAVTSTAHASNGATIAVTNVTDSATIFSHSTLTGADGTLTADTPVDMTLTEGSARVISAGDVVKVSKVEAASGVAAGGTACLVLEQRPIS